MLLKKVVDQRFCWSLIALAAVVRLFLTGDRNILALNSPHDEFWYIHAAVQNIWQAPYDQMAFMNLQTYAGWLGLWHLLGVPARLAIDLAWLAGCAYLALALQTLTRKSWVALLAFVFLAFHPYVLFIFDRALAETFLTVISVATLAAGLELWNCRDDHSAGRRRTALIVYTVGFALAYHTRKEGIVLAVPLLLLAAYTLFDRRRWWHGDNRPAHVVSFLFAPLGAALLFGVVLCLCNYLTWGIWARYELAAPGYARAVSALNSIDDGPTPRQISVTKAMLALAYQQSPTLRQLQPAMDHGVGQGWVAIASPYTPLKGEIGNGWFYWALRDVAAASGWYANARQADANYAAVADELDRAFDSGSLKRRLMLTSFLDPDFSKWLPLVPGSSYSVLQLLLKPQGQIEASSENASAAQFDEYARITGRRDAPRRVTVGGWIVAPAGSLVGLGAAGVAKDWQRLGDHARPDVPGAWAFDVDATGVQAPDTLFLTLPDGRQGNLPLALLKRGSTATVAGAATAFMGIDTLQVQPPVHRADRWLQPIERPYVWFSYGCAGAVLFALLLGVLRRGSPVLTLILLLLLATIAARVALFGILDASSWSGIQARYIMPVLPFFACAGALGLAMIIDFLIAATAVSRRPEAA
jgi:hypothetical protein